MAFKRRRTRRSFRKRKRARPGVRRFVRARRKFVNPGTGSRWGGDSSIIKIKRGFNALNLAGSAAYTPYIPATSINGIQLYRLSDLPNYTEFTALFEEYMITGVKLSFTLRRSVQVQSTGATNSYSTHPHLYYNVDITGNDITASNINGMLEQPNTKRVRLQTEKSTGIYLQPRTSNIIYNTGVTPAYGVNRAQWIPTAYPNVYHYGLKMLIDEFTDTGNFVDCIATYYVKFRGCK